MSGSPTRARFRRIDAIGDLEPLAQEVAHARRLEQRAQRDLEVFIRENVPALLEGFQPEAEAVAQAVNAAATTLADELDRFIAVHDRVRNIVVAVRGDVRSIPGFDPAVDLRRTARSVDLPAPIPELD